MDTISPAVTGLGLICSLGKNKFDSFETLISKRDVFNKPTQFSLSEKELKKFNVGEVLENDDALFKDINLSKYSKKIAGRFEGLVLKAVKEALDESSLKINELTTKRIGIFGGTSVSGTRKLELFYRDYISHGKSRTLKKLLNSSYSPVTDLVSNVFGIEGPRVIVSTACSSGTVILNYAKSAIDNNDIDAAIVIGADTLCELSLAGFYSMGALSKEKSQPFSEGPPGIILGEGAACIILEKNAPKEKVYAYIRGCGASADGYHATAPHSRGEGARRAMSQAVQSGKSKPSDIDFIIAHGTGTTLNDSAESSAINNFIKDYSNKPKVMSTKGQTGHILGGAGTLNAVIACLALKNGQLPPSTNFTSLRKGCNLSISTETIEKQKLNGALVNSFGFGGNNSSTYFSVYPIEEEQKEVILNKDLVITAVGAVSPFGLGTYDLEQAIIHGYTKYQNHEPIYSFSGRKYNTQAAMLPFNDEKIQTSLRTSRESRKMDRLSKIAMLATNDLISSLKISLSKTEKESTGLILGTGTAPMEVIEKFFSGIVKNGLQKGVPGDFANTVLNACLGYINSQHQILGPTALIPQCENAGAISFYLAELILNQSKSFVNRVICGGVDEYSYVYEKAFLDLGMIPSNSLKHKKTIPMDSQSKGCLLGEGGITFMLERKGDVVKNKTPILANYKGTIFSNIKTNNPYSFPSHKNSVVDVLKKGVERFGEPDLIITNASGYNKLDKLLCGAIEDTFKQCVPIYSPLGLFGNVRGSVAPLSIYSAIVAFDHQLIPGIPGCTEPRIKNAISDVSRPASIKKAFILTLAPGGQATLTIVEKNYT